jgi:hypothetical protein
MSEHRYVLVTMPPAHDLDGYQFRDLTHAHRWCQQAFVTDTAYKVALESVSLGQRHCPDCGRRSEKRHRIRTMKVSTFLREYAQETGDMTTIEVREAMPQIEALLRATFPTWDAAEAWLDTVRPLASGRPYRGRTGGTLSAGHGNVVAWLWVWWAPAGHGRRRGGRKGSKTA